MRSEPEYREEIEQDLCPHWVPKEIRDLLWRDAWESGHSCGVYAVRQDYDERMDAVRALAPYIDHSLLEARKGGE